MGTEKDLVVVHHATSPSEAEVVRTVLAHWRKLSARSSTLASLCTKRSMPLEFTGTVSEYSSNPAFLSKHDLISADAGPSTNGLNNASTLVEFTRWLPPGSSRLTRGDRGTEQGFAPDTSPDDS